MRNRNYFQTLMVLGVLTSLTACGDDPAAPQADPGAGHAVELDGDVAYVAVEDSRETYAFVHGTGIFTIEAWVKLDDPDDDQFFAIAGNTYTNSQYGFYFGLENRGSIDHQLRINICGGGHVIINALSDPGAITDDDWHHVAVVGDGDEVIFYVDGVQWGDTDGMSGLGLTFATRDLLLGDIYSSVGGGDWHWDGELDEVRVWSVTRSQDDLRKTMHGTLGDPYTKDAGEGLMGYWRFDRALGLNVGGPGQDVRDHSLSNRHADLVMGARLTSSEAF